MFQYKNRAVFETIRVATAAAIGATYATIGTVTTAPCVLFKFINLTNGDVFISDDGVNDKWIVPVNGYAVYDIRTNSPTVCDYMLSQNTQFYVKDGPTATTTGSFYIETMVVTRE